jgi:hypothetical protein
MKYETPELTVLNSAISAIQSNGGKKLLQPNRDAIGGNEQQVGYADWE